MLLTYNEYNKDLGYVQGMSDLLAPIYAVMQDDAVAFWGFVGFMKRMVSPLIWTPASAEDADHSSGTKLPARPIRHAPPAPHPRPSRPAHGSKTLPPSAERRVNKLLLLLPHASRLVQARTSLERRPQIMGIALDGSLQQ